MRILNSKRYNKDVAEIAELRLNWEKLKGKSVAISGGTGLIGSFLVDVLMYRNERFNQNTDIYVLGRDKKKAMERFEEYGKSIYYNFLCQDINQPISCLCDGMEIGRMDYIIHAAGNTHPVAYATDPVGTIAANVMGTNNLLHWATKVKCERFVFLSSVEIYGENRGDIDKFTEDYLGYIDCNTLRAGYPESKRTGEALCQAYKANKGIDVVIPRLSRVYGPTMLEADTKAISQFIKNCVMGEDIVLKSEGTQEYSYSYVGDAVFAILKVLVDGQSGEAYNIASASSDITLRELAKLLADYAGTKVVYDIPEEDEKAGYSKATKATLDISKLKKLDWKPKYDISRGLRHTVDILREKLEL
ncbi:MAG: NAD-dependent epimerase/dehydratase family protein [Lachnospiraceae bacterium]|nr:NAD-dependent epimerase/dehydratase family protein [Lachnospiraceae bacterium]